MAISPVANSANQRFDGRRSSDPGYGGNTPRVELERFCNADRMDNTDNTRLEGFGSGYKTERGRPGTLRPVATASESLRLEYATGDGREQRGAESGRGSLAAGCPPGGLADTIDSTGHGSQSRGIVRELPQGVGALQTERRPTGPVNGRWSDADWLFCRDGKWRPVEPGTFPLANGAPARVGRLRAYGNAINAEAAEAIIRAYMECRP
jgi:DNA (cytosine-5)-methyltransferase 1